MRRLAAFFFCAMGIVPLASAQQWGEAVGTIREADTREPLPGVTVVVTGTNFGTASTSAGTWSLRMPAGRYALRFSAVGFEARTDSIFIRTGRISELNVTLRAATVDLEGVVVEEDRQTVEAGVFTVTPEAARDIPTPVRDVARVLKVLPGVATNNEMSNQVSVRGGGFNENLYFINGFEIFLPFRPRQGEQEGLSLMNAELADGITFYSGGFPARYGGKLASAVEVSYRNTESESTQPSGAAYASLLDAGVSAGGAVIPGRLGWLAGVRKSRPRRFFGTQELQGDYDPDFTDAQVSLRWRPNARAVVEVLGIRARHQFTLNPNARRTFFGTVSQDTDLAPTNLQSMWIRYDAGNEEVDGYETTFGGLRITTPIGRIRAEHAFSLFDTEESERFELSGSALLFLVDPGAANPRPDDGLFPIGNSRQEDAADNRVAVRTLTGSGRYSAVVGNHALEAGWQLRDLEFDDRIEEKSVISGRSTDGTPVRIVADSLTDAASLGAFRGAWHVQDAIALPHPARDGFLLTIGLRGDYFDFNDEWTVSPRVTARYRLDANTVLLGSWGIYHQSPSYRELRGKPEIGETILGALNRDLKSQRSTQFVAGIEYFLPRLRFVLRGEAYHKRIANLISYDIDNVRVRYSGNNDGSARASGLDLQLRGEFVPGMESWVNYSFLHAREDLTGDGTSAVPRPTDQRHTVSIYLQDYIPNDPQWRLHMRMLFGSGLPYTPPVPGPRVGNLLVQAPGDRFSARYPRYFRFDMGVTRELDLFERSSSQPVRLEATMEVLNVFDMTNTVSYTWIPNAAGIWTRVPTRLTPRTFNVRARVIF
ncbi:MAG: TonB-dependent receptor [Rhodothermales bacterium]|nr:TonB-dependent receptor [Rhodothermales bacterium]MBO6780363.1 TonB-dependent receptor [Rhodothermales bacterium]